MPYKRRLALAKAIATARRKGINVRTVKWANGEMGIYSRKSYNSDMLPPSDDPKDFSEWWDMQWESEYGGDAPKVPKSMTMDRKNRMVTERQKGRRKGLDVNIRRRGPGKVESKTAWRNSGVNTLLGENIFVRRGTWGNLPIESTPPNVAGSGSIFTLFRGGENRPMERLESSGMMGSEFLDRELNEDTSEALLENEINFDSAIFTEGAEKSPEYFIRPLTPIKHFLIKKYGDYGASDYTIGGGSLEDHYNITGNNEDPRGGYYNLLEDAPISEDAWAEHLSYPAIIYGVSTTESESHALGIGKEYTNDYWEQLPVRRWILRMSASLGEERGGFLPNDSWHYRLWQTMKEAHKLSTQNPDALYAIGDHQVFFDKEGTPLGWQDGTDYDEDDGDQNNVALFYGGKMWNISQVDFALQLAIWNDFSPSAKRMRTDFNKRYFGVEGDPGKSDTETGNMAFVEWVARKEAYPPDGSKFVPDENGNLHLDPNKDTKDIKRNVGLQTAVPSYQGYGSNFGKIPYDKRLWNYQRFAFDKDMPDWIHGWEDKYMLDNDSVALNKKWDKQLAKDYKYSDNQGRMSANAIEDFIDKKSDFSNLPAAILAKPIGGSSWDGGTEKVGEIRRAWKSILGDD